MTELIANVQEWRPPVFKSFNPTSSIASAIFGHAFGVAVAFLTYDIIQSAMVSEEEMSVHLQRFIAFVGAFISGTLSFFIMWFLFGLGYTARSHT